MNARIRWLRAQGPTSTTVLEIPVSLLVMVAMALVAAFGYGYAQRHVHVMEVLGVMAAPRVSMMEYRAVTGEWPTSNRQAAYSDELFTRGSRDLYRVNSVRIRAGGAIDFGLSPGEAPESKVVSVRAWTGPAPGLPLSWTCGRAPSLRGTAAAADLTTLSEEDLPSPCRAHK